MADELVQCNKRKIKLEGGKISGTVVSALFQEYSQPKNAGDLKRI